MVRRTLYRWHIRLAWVIAIPLLLWTTSGLFMVARPIDEVRGTALKATPAPLRLEGLALPQVTGPATALRLVSVGAAPIWVVEQGGQLTRYDARTGTPLPAITAATAQALATAHYPGGDRVLRVDHFTADKPPLALRKARPSWQVMFADGTHVYIDAATGEPLALRTRQWRAFDLMWGLHIMDPMGRENTSHPLLIGAALVAWIAVLLALVQLGLRVRR